MCVCVYHPPATGNCVSVASSLATIKTMTMPLFVAFVFVCFGMGWGLVGVEKGWPG